MIGGHLCLAGGIFEGGSLYTFAVTGIGWTITRTGWLLTGITWIITGITRIITGITWTITEKR